MTEPTVLLTGATGFLGGAVAADLLRWPEPVRVLLLVRAPGAQAAESRVRRSLARFAEAGRPDFSWDRCTALPGDVTEPASLADPRLDEVTHVLHLAANTSFRSVRGVRATNIEGTRALARRLRAARGLARFLHVGTAFICGTHPPRTVAEDDYPRPGVRHLVEYTRSKAEAELLLGQMASELPLVVARPSIVVGHTRLGCGPSASIFWYYRALALLRRVPVPPEVRKDIVPVDYVAAALLRLLFRPGLRHGRYHISAGQTASVSWREIFEAFALCSGSGTGGPCRVVSHAEFARERARLREVLGPGDEQRLLQALEPFFRLSACGVEVFDNGRLLAEGVPAPPRFTDYLPVCVGRPPGRGVYEQFRDDD
jgi:nucleoside-diphosphate-sugar epimerase